MILQLESREVKPNPGENPLQCPYVFWFSRRPPGKVQSATNYENNIKIVGKFASVSLINDIDVNTVINKAT